MLLFACFNFYFLRYSDYLWISVFIFNFYILIIKFFLNKWNVFYIFIKKYDLGRNIINILWDI